MSEQTDGVRLAGSVLHRRCHACAFFNTREEEYRLLLPFTQEGFGRGDKAFQIVDRQHRQERLQRLKEAGIDTDATTRTGQLEIRAWGDAYLRGGRFDQNAMLALVDEVLSGGKSDG